MRLCLCILCSLTLIFQANAQSFELNVFDVGAGLCIGGVFPNEKVPEDPYYMVYDAGFGCIDHVALLIPQDQDIDLLVLSHNDSDHIATADDILKAYRVLNILWTGFERPGVQNWVDVNDAIENESGACVVNIRTDTPAIGSTRILGETYLSFVAGFHVPPEEWGFAATQTSEYRNAGSIAMRITHKGKSILLTGDMIGRHENDDQPEYHIIAAEKYVMDNRFAVPINSDVLVASHHGGNDASSYPFIQAVSPEYVIFSAGSHDGYGHPRSAVAQRFLNSGVSLANIFRTDFGDDESKPEHWENESSITGHSDGTGDDNILITISDTGELKVNYTQ